MEFAKSVLTESLQMTSEGKETFSEKPQSIVISEAQLERLIENLSK